MYCDEPAEPDLSWRERYHAKITTCDQSLLVIKPGQRIFLATGCAQPLPLVLGLVGRSATLAGNEVVDLFTFGEAPYARRDWSDQIHINTFFIADNVREIVQQGVGGYTPMFLSEIPRLFATKQITLDVALIQVTPPDTQGRCSLGISVDIVAAAVRHAKVVIAQVNALMPRTLGESFVQVDDLDWLVPIDLALPEYRGQEADPTTTAVAKNIASLVEDGSTLELGIGQIPQETLHFLTKRRHLGIHSEMVTDSVLELIRAGAVDGSHKTQDRHQIVVSFCMGTQTLYDFIHNNPLFSFRPTEYVNNALIIGQHHRMVAINTALEIDLTGQVCAESIGSRFYSGVGGHADFNRGATQSKEGKAIIAFTSTAQQGKTSRIVTYLSPGAGVTATRPEVHYVVTEYGVAYLHGRSIQQRALALIGLAHPDFREQLLQEAIDNHLIHPELSDVRGRMLFGPREYNAIMELENGATITFRVIQPMDDQPLRNLFYTMSQQDLYTRFMSHIKRLTFQKIKDLIYIDHRKAVALVGVVPIGEHGEEIVAMGGYYLEGDNQAEVAFVVRDEWKDKGIGSFLFKSLVAIARKGGVARFTASAMAENRSMLRVFQHSGLPVRQRAEDGVYEFEMDLKEPPIPK